MSKARIIFEYNNKTGKKDIHIDYESDPSSLPYEHEEEHRNIVKRVINTKSLQGDKDVEVTRPEPEIERQPYPQKENRRLQPRTRSKERE